MLRIVPLIASLQEHLDRLACKPDDYRPPACPKCGFARLWGHGHYVRKADRETGELNPVPIPRFRCGRKGGCRATCSMVPSCLPPRRWYLWSVQMVAKTRQTRHVFLNEEAMSVLNQWREQSIHTQRVFPMSTGFRTAWKSLLKRANIVRFRWHDMRHHFASSLVQIGVPLNTVRDLLGHASVAMSLRYAHLAPDQRREAVTKLSAKRSTPSAMRPEWDFDPNRQPVTD